MSDPVEQAAQAIWLAEPSESGVVTRPWTDKYPVEGMKEEYRVKARAAIGALGLTEEWSVERGQGVFAYVSDSRYPDREAAAASAKRINERYWKDMKHVPGAEMSAPNAHPVSRLVGGWTGEQQEARNE